MDWQQEFLKSFLGPLAVIVGTILAGYIIAIAKSGLAYLQAKAKDSGNAATYAAVTIAVQAAEQRIDKVGEDRLTYVEELLTKWGVKFDRGMVESAVYDLNIVAKPKSAEATPVQYTTGIAQVGTLVAGTPTVTTTSQAADTQG